MINGYRVIDFHIHIGDVRHYAPGVIDFFNSNNSYYRENCVDNVTSASVLEYLRRQGVELAVTMAEYNPRSSGTVPKEFIADVCAGHDKLIAFAAIDFDSEVPPVEQLKYSVEKLGMRGLKMYPPYAHYYPDDPELFPLYRAAMEMGLPVMFHTGSSIFAGSRIKYGDPFLLDAVADEFPDLVLLLEHGGRPFWYDRAAWMVTRHRNVHIGLAGLPAKQLMANFKNIEKNADRFVFGSDWPGIPDISTMAEKIMDLPISKEVKEMIFFHNARRILGI